MSNWEEIKRRLDESKKDQEKDKQEEEKGHEDKTQKRKKVIPPGMKDESQKETTVSPSAPLIRCIKCNRTHRKGECRG
ncbi:MAG: hypothetical protein ACHQJ6_07195 [Candidatus Berkiellales bacterium]